MIREFQERYVQGREEEIVTVVGRKFVAMPDLLEIFLGENARSSGSTVKGIPPPPILVFALQPQGLNQGREIHCGIASELCCARRGELH